MELLDSIALVTLPEHALLPRLAALFCQEYKCGRNPRDWDEVAKWVWDGYGPILDQNNEEPLAKDLFLRIKAQQKTRENRRYRLLRGGVDSLTYPLGSRVRIAKLLESRLGSARIWTGQHRMGETEFSLYGGYADGAVFSGIVAGVIQTAMKLRRIENPSLLVYSRRSDAPKAWWIPGHITTVTDAFLWVIPPEAVEFLHLEGTRVEHDTETQECRLITQFGTKALPWRKLIPPV